MSHIFLLKVKTPKHFVMDLNQFAYTSFYVKDNVAHLAEGRENENLKKNKKLHTQALTSEINLPPWQKAVKIKKWREKKLKNCIHKLLCHR